MYYCIKINAFLSIFENYYVYIFGNLSVNFANIFVQRLLKRMCSFYVIEFTYIVAILFYFYHHLIYNVHIRLG